MWIYTFDPPPPHVHVWKVGAVAKIDLPTYEEIEIGGAFPDRHIKGAERLVAQTRGPAETGSLRVLPAYGACQHSHPSW